MENKKKPPCLGHGDCLEAHLDTCTHIRECEDKVKKAWEARMKKKFEDYANSPEGRFALNSILAKRGEKLIPDGEDLKVTGGVFVGDVDVKDLKKVEEFTFNTNDGEKDKWAM